MGKFKVTTAFLKVLTYFFSIKERRISGIDVVRHTGLQSGTVYPILNRMEKTGWVDGIEEDIDPKEAGRPKRRFYELTDNGITNGHKLLAEYIPDAKGYLEWRNTVTGS